MKPFKQDPITQASQGRSSAPANRPRNRVSKVCEFTRRRAVPLGLATTIALALTACAAIRNQEAARDDRIKSESDPAPTTAERADPKTKRQEEVSAPAPVKESPSSEYDGPLRREAKRGILTVRFEVPGDRPDEICVIPRHLSFAHYRGKDGTKDRADERRLASYDFYKAGTAESGAIGISPKRTSTSAAVLVYELPAGTSRPQHLTAAYCRSMEKEGKKVAKFKQTDNRYTATSTAAILGYYHVSRALGDICEIKPAVLRTMDIPQHKKIVRLASQMEARGTVAKSWALFHRYYANPKRSGVVRDLFTSDYTQIYGALLENTRGEDDYTEWLKAGSELSSTRAFRKMADARPVASILGSNAFTQRNVQALVAMRDMSELILLDYLLAQSDRLSGGNISSYEFAYDLFGGEVKSAKASKAPDRASNAPRVIVKKLTIKDTDGGLLNSNVFERKGYLTRIRHLHPRTYNALQRFAREWEKDPAVKAFFHQECTFSTSQLARFEKYLRTAAATLRKRRESGTLHLDLDLDDYFKGVEPYPSDEGLPDIPKLGFNELEDSAWKPLGGATSKAHPRILEGLSSTSETRFAKPDLDNLPKGVERYPSDKALPDLPRLGLTELDISDRKPLRGATSKANLPKGVERYPSDKAFSDLPKLGLTKLDISDRKPLRGATSKANLPKGVERYPSDKAFPDLPKLGLTELDTSDRKPLRGATSKAHPRIPEGQSSASETRFAKPDLDDLPKGVERYPSDKAFSDLPKLGLTELDISDWKPLRGVASDAPAEIPARPSPTPKTALAKADLEETN